MQATHVAIVQEGEKSEGASTQGRVDHSRPTAARCLGTKSYRAASRRRMGHLPISADAPLTEQLPLTEILALNRGQTHLKSGKVR